MYRFYADSPAVYEVFQRRTAQPVAAGGAVNGGPAHDVHQTIAESNKLAMGCEELVLEILGGFLNF